jgi:hypothetical protein
MSETTITVEKKTPATLKAVTEFFRREGETLKGFTEEWKQLTDEDKEQIKEGIGNGTLTY